MNDTTLILAASDSVALWLLGAQMLFNVLFVLFMFALRRKFAETDDLRKKVNQRDEKIRTQVDLAVKQEIGTLAEAIARIERRLSEGDKRFDKLQVHDHQAELTRVGEVHKLREWVMNHCATKTGVKEMATQVAALREALIRVETERATGGAA